MSDYKYPDLVPGETFASYVARAAKEYVRWCLIEQDIPKEVCLTEYRAFVASEKARIDSNIKRLLRSQELDPRELYMRPALFYNYKTLVPDDYEVTQDNIDDAKQRLKDLFVEHMALDADRERYERLPPEEQRKYTLTTLLYATVDPRVATNPEYSTSLQAENMMAMRHRRAAAEECIKRLKNKIDSVINPAKYDEKEAFANKKSAKKAKILHFRTERQRILAEQRAEGLRLRAERNRIMAEKAERLAYARAERNRIMAERSAMLNEQRAERSRIMAARESRIAAEKAEKLRRAQQKGQK